MAKWNGKVGYAICEETRPGVWNDSIVEKPYFGDVIKNTSSWSPSSDSINDDLNVGNQISIVANPFAYQNFQHIKYVEFMGAFWKVKNIDVQRPRLILTIGGVYNGKRATTA